jgi:nucleoside-diphosphate-sugar epimerase
LTLQTPPELKSGESLAREFTQFFENKHVLITGAAGFIGSWLTDVIIEARGKVDCVDNLSTGKRDNLEHLKDRVNIFFSDVEKFSPSNGEKYDYIFHFSSRASPEEYQEHPVETLEANSTGTRRMLELARKYDARLIYACHDDRTRVLTQGGFKFHSEVKEGELVFTLNLETRALELKPVLKVHSYDYKGRMIFFRGGRVDQAVTPNHGMLIETVNYQSKPKYEEAREVSKRSVFKFTRARLWSGKNIPLKIEGALEDIFYLVGLYIGDGWSDIHIGKRMNVTGYGRTEYLEKCRDSLGHFTLPSNPGKQEYTIMTSYRNMLYIPKMDKSRQKIEDCLNRLNVKWSSNGKYDFIYFGGKPWVELFQQCGTNAHDKHVPRWMLGYETSCLRSLLQGMVDSDGYVRKGQEQFRIQTASEGLVRDICEIALKLGRFVSFSKIRTNGIIDGRRISGNSYVVYLTNSDIFLGKVYPQSICEEEYDGRIYCLEVQDNHNYVVERNGKVAFSGNSTSEIYGDAQVIPTPETYFGNVNPIGVRSCYDEGKRYGEALCMAFFRSYQLKVRIPRIFNTYGERIREDGIYARALPRFVKQALNDEPITIYGDGNQTRSFCYVTDTVKGILKLATQEGIDGEVFNIGNPQEMTILALASKIIEKTESKSKITHHPPMPDDPRRRKPDISKASRVLSWSPEADLDYGLGRTIDYFRNRP